MPFLYNPFSGDIYPGTYFDMTKLITAHYELLAPPPLLYRQTSVEAYIIDNDGNFIVIG